MGRLFATIQTALRLTVITFLASTIPCHAAEETVSTDQH